MPKLVDEDNSEPIDKNHQVFFKIAQNTIDPIYSIAQYEMVNDRYKFILRTYPHELKQNG